MKVPERGALLLIATFSFVACAVRATAQVSGVEVNCVDGIDNDRDGFVDCDDADCAVDRPEQCDCAGAPINVIFQAVPLFDGTFASDSRLFANYTPRIPTRPGRTVVFVGIVSQLAGSATGIQGWSMGIRVDDALTLDATTAGTIAQVAPPGKRVPLSFEVTEVTHSTEFAPDNEGAVSAVVLAFTEDVSLDREGTATGLVIEVEVPDPVRGALSCREQSFPIGQPIEFLFTVAGESRQYCHCFGTELVAARRSFRRGDANDDGIVNIADPVFTLRYLFQGRATPSCLETADADNNGTIELTDGIVILRYLFSIGDAPPPAPPGPARCGVDPDVSGSAGDLGCERFSHCG